MALRTYVKEAWEDIADLQTPEVNGARETAECARAYISDAWEEVWSAVKFLKLYSESLRNVHTVSPTEWGEKFNIWTMHDDGSIIYLTEQDSLNNPTISFGYWGYCNYDDVRTGYNNSLSVGSLYAYGIKADGTSESVMIDEYVNTTGISDSRMKSASYTFTGGDYQRIGFKVKFFDHSDNLTSDVAKDIIYHFAIKEILIDNGKYITDATEDFEQGTF